MLPKLYDSFATETADGPQDFLGTITHCTKCLVTEVRNGEYTLELETTTNDPTAEALLSQTIIGAKPNPADPVQYFEVQSSERTLDGKIKVVAKHIKLFLCQLVSEGDLTTTDREIFWTITPQQAYDKLFSDLYIRDTTGFTFTSNIQLHNPFAAGFNNPKSLGAIFGGEDGSMLDVYGGEFYYNNYSIQLLASRGKVTNYSLRYGKNISSAKQSENCTQAYSHIRPWCSVQRTDGKSIHIYSPEYEIPNHECKTKKVLPLDCSDAVQKMTVGTEGQGYNDVKAAITAAAVQYASANGIGKVAVGIEVTTRAELDGMLSLGLCDTVKVILDNFNNLSTTAKITSVTYNSLLERWEKMTVGSISASLADIILDRRRFNLK